MHPAPAPARSAKYTREMSRENRKIERVAMKPPRRNGRREKAKTAASGTMVSKEKDCCMAGPNGS